ncbi:MAG: hypothetical protein ACXWGX_10390, partial [Usitatibacter sp.]
RRTGERVVLKEGRPYAGLDIAGRDAVTRLHHERDILQRLSGLDVVPRVVDFFAENALEHERIGECIERIGLIAFLEGVGLEVDPNMVTTPRTNPYVRTDGWDEEVARMKAMKSPKEAA